MLSKTEVCDQPRLVGGPKAERTVQYCRCGHFAMKPNSVSYFARSDWSVSATKLNFHCGMPTVCTYVVAEML